MVGPGRPQLVGDGEVTVEAAQVAAHPRQRRHLMDDNLRLGSGDRLADGRGVQAIDHRRLRAERAQLPGLGRVPGRRGHLVPLPGELGQQLPPNCPGSSCNENTHADSFRKIRST